MLTTNIRKTAITVAALGALGLGGAAIAGAADSNNSSGSSTSSSQTRQDRHRRQALSSDAAARVKAAALAKVPGATVLDTEAGGPYGTPYHAHIRTSSGALQVVLVNSSFNATAVQSDNGRGGDRGHDGDGHRGGRGGDETALTGDAKTKVEAAVTTKYSGATILRSETNADSNAPYEAHIRTSGGQELEVHVSKDFQVVDAQQHPAHP